ncbi:MAG: hypothetical protein ACLFQ0_00580 [Cyclobacteriaceae bacterium]
MNLEEQINNLSTVSFIQEEWENGEFPYINAWVYSLRDGILKDLHMTRNNSRHLDEVYCYVPRARVKQS